MASNISHSAVRILNSTRKLLNGEDDWDNFSYYVELCLADYKGLKNSCDRLVPFISGVESVEDVNADLQVALTEQEQILINARDIATTQNFDELSLAMAALDENSFKIASLLAEFSGKEGDALRVSTARSFNDLIILSIEAARGNDVKSRLIEQIPKYSGYISYIEGVLDEIKRRFPDKDELYRNFAEQVQTLKEAAGRINLFIREQKPEDITAAVIMLEQAGKNLWAAFYALIQAYMQSGAVSETPVLDDVYMDTQSYKAGKINTQAMESSLKRLKVIRDQDYRELENFENYVFMKPETSDLFMPKIKEILSRQNNALANIKNNIGNPAAVEAAVIEYGQLVKKLNDLRKMLAFTISDKPSLAEASHFEDLLDLVVAVYELRMPEIRLEDKASFIDQFQEDFRRRLFLEEKRHPETSGIVGKLFDLLDKQRSGLDLIFEYLESSDRRILIEAYVIIENATIDFINISEEIKENSDLDDTNSGMTAFCPYCFEPNYPHSRNCSKCGTLMPTIESGISGRGINFTDSGSGPAVSENFKFIKEVIEDTISGVLTFEESEEMLMPYWTRIQDVQKNLRDNIMPIVKKSNDPELAESFRNFKDIVAYFQETLKEIFKGIKSHNSDLLRNNLTAILDSGSELYNLHIEIENALSNIEKEQ